MTGNQVSSKPKKLTYDQFGQHLTTLALFVRSQFAGVSMPSDAYRSVMKDLVENEHQIETYVRLAVESRPGNRIATGEDIAAQENEIKLVLAICSSNINDLYSETIPTERQQEMGNDALLFLVKHGLAENIVSMKGNSIGLKVSHSVFKSELNQFCKLTTEVDDIDDDEREITIGECSKTAFRFTVEQSVDQCLSYFKAAPLTSKTKKATAKSGPAKKANLAPSLDLPLQELIRNASCDTLVHEGHGYWAILNIDFEELAARMEQFSHLRNDSDESAGAFETMKGKTKDGLKFRISEHQTFPGGGSRIELRGHTKNPAKRLVDNVRNMPESNPAQRMDKLLTMLGISASFVLKEEGTCATVEKRSGISIDEVLEIVGFYKVKGAGSNRYKCKLGKIKFDLLDHTDKLFQIILRKESAEQ